MERAKREKPDAYLGVWIYDLPANFIYQNGRELRQPIKNALSQGVIRIISGAEFCHVFVNVKRPYFRPRQMGLI